MRILITERFLPEAELKLKHLGHEVKRAKNYASATPEEIAYAEIAIIRSKTQINDEFLEQAESLHFVITLTSGLDHIDKEACKRHGVKWTHTPYANRVATGELTIALALQSLRHLKKINLSSEKTSLNRELLIGTEIYEKTWGIMGLGRVGSYVAKLAKGFGANILAYDPYIENKVFKDHQAERVSLNELFKCSDIVSLHIPKTKETHHIITFDLLKDLGAEGLFINMAREHVLSTDVLLKALKEKCIGMVALDVFDISEVTKAQITTFPNVFLSPHLGAATKEALERASYEAIDIIQKMK